MANHPTVVQAGRFQEAGLAPPDTLQDLCDQVSGVLPEHPTATQAPGEGVDEDSSAEDMPEPEPGVPRRANRMRQRAANSAAPAALPQLHQVVEDGLPTAPDPGVPAIDSDTPAAAPHAVQPLPASTSAPPAAPSTTTPARRVMCEITNAEGGVAAAAPAAVAPPPAARGNGKRKAPGGAPVATRRSGRRGAGA